MQLNLRTGVRFPSPPLLEALKYKRFRASFLLNSYHLTKNKFTHVSRLTQKQKKLIMNIAILKRMTPLSNEYTFRKLMKMGKIRGSHFPNVTGCRAGKAKQ